MSSGGGWPPQQTVSRAPAGGRLEPADGDRAEPALDHLPQERLVQRAQDRLRGALAHRGGAHRVAGDACERGRGRALAADVADGQVEAALARLEGVVEVAADVAAAAGRVVDGGQLDPGDVGQVGRQQAALERAGDLVAVLVEPGGVDGRCGPAGELGREREVVVAVDAARLGRDERQRPVRAPARRQRDDDHRPHAEPAQDGAMLVVARRSRKASARRNGDAGQRSAPAPAASSGSGG